MLLTADRRRVCGLCHLSIIVGEVYRSGGQYAYECYPECARPCLVDDSPSVGMHIKKKPGADGWYEWHN